MPYLNCEGSSERREISSVLVSMDERRKLRKRSALLLKTILEDMKAAARNLLHIAEEALFQAADNDHDENTESSDNPHPWEGEETERRTETASSHSSDNDHGEETESGDDVHAWEVQDKEGRSSRTNSQNVHSGTEEGSNPAIATFSSNSEESRTSEMFRESKRDDATTDKLKAGLQERLKGDRDLIWSYLDHESPLHVSILT